jgi:hypothetical protein
MLTICTLLEQHLDEAQLACEETSKERRNFLSHWRSSVLPETERDGRGRRAVCGKRSAKTARA